MAPRPAQRYASTAWLLRTAGMLPRRLALALAAALLAIAPLAARPGTAATLPVAPVFGPSIHLVDPSTYPASDANYPGQPLPDDEPSIAIAPDGTVWVAALHMHDGTALWRGRFGLEAPTFVGMPDHGIGGQDVAIALGAGPTPALYTASLVPITAPVTAWRVAVTVCPGSDVARRFGACTFYPHLAYGQRDRPWLVAAGRSTVYLSYVTRQENVLTGQMTVRRSDDGGRAWIEVGDPTSGLETTGDAPLHGWPGTLAASPLGGTVYEIFAVEGANQPSDDRFNRLIIAISHDRGVSWRDVTIYQGRADEDDAHMWPGLAVDAAGRLYAAWSDGHGVFLSTSTDGAATWAPPRRVDTPSPALRTSIMPWIAAGSPGHVALAWYGTTADSSLATGAGWRVWFAESGDGGRDFAQGPATGLIHRGPVCAKGDECAWDQRQLLDNLGMALDPRTGRAAIVYARSIGFGNYIACRLAANCPQTYYVEELARPR